MAMIGYFDVFPEKRTTELRTVTFSDEPADALLPNGLFIFTEYFCTNLECDCQRVIVKVYFVRSLSAPPDEVATISYSWNPSSDAMGKTPTAGLPNPFLDPLHYQAPCAPELTDFWSEMIKRDKAYASRLERHYHEIRAAIGQPGEQWSGGGLSSPAARKKSLRPPTKPKRTSRKRQSARARKRK